MSEWLREHDALIAERAEGRTVFWLPFGRSEKLEPHWVRKTGGVEMAYYDPIDHYNTDLAAVARAMEAWRLQEPDYRAWAIESHEGQIDAECRDWEKRYRGHSENGGIPHACAAALLRALGGGE